VDGQGVLGHCRCACVARGDVNAVQCPRVRGRTQSINDATAGCAVCHHQLLSRGPARR
jgi:hypothetical protein